MVRRLPILLLLVTLCLLVSQDASTQSGQDIMTNSFQNCTGIPCMTVKNAAATGPWTGTTNLNDLMTYSFQNCSGIPCMTVTGVTGGAGGSSAFNDITTGTNTTATMTVGSGASLGATGTGQINATSVPGTGITTPVPDAMIPNLNALSTGLANSKCVETSASGLLVASANACNVATVGTVSFSNITSGGNVSATMVVGAGSSLTPSGGQITATDMPGTGLSSPILDSVIPDLNTLSTGLVPFKCVETAADGRLVSTADTCDSSGGGGGGGSFSSLSSGTNTTATMIVSGSASLSADSGGSIAATSMPGEGLSSSVPVALVPNLNTIATGLTPIRCVETDATGKLVSASAVCGGVGGSGVWGAITGTLSNQTDLQAALDAKVPTSRTVNGHALTSNVSVTAADVGLGSVDNTSDAAKNSATAKLTNKQVVPRPTLLTVTTGTPNHIDPNATTTDVGYNYTLTVPITVNTPTFTLPLDDQQLLALELKSAAPQTLTWASGYSSECGLPLPTSTSGDVAGQPTYNRFLYRYSLTTTKWCLIANTKGDAVRLTTLATATTYTCPHDNSDSCEMSMTGVAGTLLVAQPTPTTTPPQNGQRLRLQFRCTNAQTFSWDAIFIDGATTTKPATCPADTSKWLTIDTQYSTALSKWSLVGGGGSSYTLPSTVVQTNQANTYASTFHQNFEFSSRLTLPRKTSGLCPTNTGSMCYDATQEMPIFGENGLLISSPTRTLFVAEGAGNSNDAGSGTSDVTHTSPTVSLPAGYLLQHRVLRICMMFRVTSTSSAPSLNLKLKFSGTIVAASNNSVVANSKTNATGSVCYLALFKDVPGGSAQVEVAPISDNNNGVSTALNILNPQPVSIATNAAMPIAIITHWNVATAGNIVTPDLLTVEAMN